MRDRVFRIVICSIAALIVTSCSVFACFAESGPLWESPFYPNGLENGVHIPSSGPYAGIGIEPSELNRIQDLWYEEPSYYSFGPEVGYVNYDFHFNVTGVDRPFRIYLPFDYDENIVSSLVVSAEHESDIRFIGTYTSATYWGVDEPHSVKVLRPHGWGDMEPYLVLDVEYAADQKFAVFQITVGDYTNWVSCTFSARGLSVVNMDSIQDVISSEAVGNVVDYFGQLLSVSYIQIMMLCAIVLVLVALLFNWLLSL